jgi:hypothetical protein
MRCCLLNARLSGCQQLAEGLCGQVLCQLVVLKDILAVNAWTAELALIGCYALLAGARLCCHVALEAWHAHAVVAAAAGDLRAGDIFQTDAANQ